MSEDGVTPSRPIVGRMAQRFDQLEAELAALEEALDAVGGPDTDMGGGGNLKLALRDAYETNDAVWLAWWLVERERRRVEKRRDLVARSIEAMDWIDCRVANPSRRLIGRAPRS